MHALAPKAATTLPTGATAIMSVSGLVLMGGSSSTESVSSRSPRPCPRTWLSLVEARGHGTTAGETLTSEEEADELLLMGLRLREGLDLLRYEALSGHALSEGARQRSAKRGLGRAGRQPSLAGYAGGNDRARRGGCRLGAADHLQRSVVTQSWLFWALLSAAFAALTAVFAKVGVSVINPDFATLIRTILVALVLAFIVGATGQAQGLATIPARSWVFLGLSALGTGASWLCYFRALKIGDAARVAPIDKLSVVLVAVFGVVVLGERLSVLNWAGVALMALGAVLIAQRL